MKHSLTNKDKVDLVATCSECGPKAPIRHNGKYGFVCLQARRAASRNYKQAHPDRARQTRALNPSTHRLTLRNGELDTCAVCGEVQPVAWGRGWMCPTIPKEKGWTVTQTAPAPKCGLCNKRWLIDGKCPKCDAAPTSYPALDRTFVDELYAAGMHIETEPSWLPTEIESAVRGWKTLGSYDQVVKNGQGFSVRPEYAALYGSGSR